MSKRRYHFKKMTQEQLAALGEKFPTTVEVITMRRPIYSTLSKMFDCGLQHLIPEVELQSEEEALAAAEAEAKQGVLAVEEGAEIELKGAPRKKVGLAK